MSEMRLGRKFNDEWEKYVDFPDSDINVQMVYAAIHGLKIKVVDSDNYYYEGKAAGYCRACDEEDGDPKLFIKADENGGWFLGMSEIKSIEEIK